MSTTTLNIRHIDREATVSIKRSAAARGWTIGIYLQHLAVLHALVRTGAAAGDKRYQEVLAAAGLEVVDL